MKQLDRKTPASLFKINAPIWNGGEKKVGLASYRIGRHNEIHFTYRRKSDGELSLPDVYYFDGNTAAEYPKQTIKGVELTLVPLSNLELLERI